MVSTNVKASHRYVARNLLVTADAERTNRVACCRQFSMQHEERGSDRVKGTVNKAGRESSPKKAARGRGWNGSTSMPMSSKASFGYKHYRSHLSIAAGSFGTRWRSFCLPFILQILFLRLRFAKFKVI